MKVPYCAPSDNFDHNVKILRAFLSSKDDCIFIFTDEFAKQ